MKVIVGENNFQYAVNVVLTFFPLIFSSSRLLGIIYLPHVIFYCKAPIHLAIKRFMFVIIVFLVHVSPWGLLLEYYNVKKVLKLFLHFLSFLFKIWFELANGSIAEEHKEI